MIPGLDSLLRWLQQEGSGVENHFHINRNAYHQITTQDNVVALAGRRGRKGRRGLLGFLGDDGLSIRGPIGPPGPARHYQQFFNDSNQQLYRSLTSKRCTQITLVNETTHKSLRGATRSCVDAQIANLQAQIDALTNGP